ncbi:GNAT family N-acetyltransferase [Peptoniphilus sp. KCTC 25270]|uniref:GNAT family N-acetyltransferase n=1 Tax=Peptoniphilus sp. KCTC 25270 TaxID=2897414 RepID=UPI001E482AC6|nr:GNAT family protein [Peptoniphilus sp. KCTC 25270]MCD1147732.1 GNAT family N-acetyltransferase [Peptoniphilus sp. KCTC 25270]
MKLRKALEEDIDFIQSLEADPDYTPYISYNSREEHLHQIYDENYTLGIFEWDGFPVGFLLGVFDPKNKVYELRRVAVSQRSKGLGRRALYLAFADGFENFGAQRLWLDVYEHNSVGISLYRSAGMVHEGILRRSDTKEGEFANQWIFSLLKEEYDLRKASYKEHLMKK